MSDQCPDIRIRQMSLSDIPVVLELERQVFPKTLRWTEGELTEHISVFPEGQLVAVDTTEKIVGTSSSLIIDWDDYAESAKWSSITGHGRFSNTQSARQDTVWRGPVCGPIGPPPRRGISVLWRSQQMVRDRGLKRLLTGGRIPGYGAVSARQ